MRIQLTTHYLLTPKPSGIALLLTVILLGGLMFVAFSASSLVSVFGQTSKVLGNSEKAYYASEAAVEQGLYQVEKLGTGIAGLSGSGSIGGTAVSWSRRAFVTSKIPLNRTDVRPQTATNPVISGSNPLLVTLPPNGSFQMDLNIVGAANPSYPSNVTVNAGSDFWYITLDTANGQVGPTMTTGKNQKFPSTGNIDPSLGLRFKITNPSSTNSDTYTIAPNGIDELPMAMVISATGVSGSEERIVEVERKAWLVF